MRPVTLPFLTLAIAATSASLSVSAQDTRHETLRESGDAIAPPYAHFTDAAEITFPQGTHKLALLIGNSKYDKAPLDTQHPLRFALTPVNGCKDAESIAERLVAIGWQKEEVGVICDLSTNQLESALRSFLNARPDDDQKLLVVYLAGHGMSVDEKNYFFGVDALPDYDEAAKILARNKLNNNEEELFGRDAIDIEGAFTRRLGSRPNFPLLVIVDTCRNNPFIEKMARALSDELSKHSDTDQKKLLQYLVASSTRPVTGAPNGASFVFATSKSNTIVDDGGTGKSRLTAALDTEIVAQRTIKLVFQQVNERLDEANRLLPDPSLSQRLTQEGALWADINYGEWCFYGCQRPGVRPSNSAFQNPVHSSRQILANSRTFWEATLAQRDSPIVVPASPKQSASGVLYQSKGPIAPEQRGMTLDIFWCEGGPDESIRREEARSFGLSARANINNSPQTLYGSSRFETVRLRPLSERTNARPGYQRNDNSLYVDRDDSDEQAAAKDLIRNRNLRVAAVSKRSPGYVSAFFCRDAFHGKTSPPLYVQVPSVNSLADASNVISFLDKNFDNVDVQRKAEVVIDSPESSEVRYYRADEADEAAKIADALTKFTGVKVQVKNLCPQPEKCLSQDEKNIEYWLGSKDASRISTLPPYQQEQTR